MSIITPADFTVDNELPDKARQGNDIQSYIDKYEPRYLVEVLGEVVYGLFLAGLPVGTVSTTALSGTVTGVGTTFTTFFAPGDPITINGETQEVAAIASDTELTTVDVWVGDNTGASYYKQKRWIDLLALPSLKPAIVDYVYWFYLKKQNEPIYNTGAGQAKQKNAVRVSPYPSMVAAWNEMVAYNKAINKFLSTGDVYPEYTPVWLPTWFYWNGFYPLFNWGWYWECGELELPEIYRIKNSLGL